MSHLIIRRYYTTLVQIICHKQAGEYILKPMAASARTRDKKSELPPQLAVFDIDGTITKPHATSIPGPVINGILHLRQKGVITTICTGRPYARMKEALGENFDVIISDDALIAVEHGAKIVNKKGEVVVETEFDEYGINHIIEFTGVNLDMVKFLTFHPGDLSRKSQIWCPEPADVDFIHKERHRYADVWQGTLADVKKKLNEQPVSLVSLKLKSHIKVENLKLEFTKTATKIIMQDGYLEYVRSRVNKGRAIEYMAKRLGVFEHHILVAGNAINDVDMLNMEAGHRILVGEDSPQRDTILGYLYGQEYMTFVDTPEDLGRFLQKF